MSSNLNDRLKVTVHVAAEYYFVFVCKVNLLHDLCKSSEDDVLCILSFCN